MPLNTFNQSIFSNATVTSSGSSVVFNNYSSQIISLIVNITGAVTGTTPTITFTISEVDPGNLTTLIGSTKTGATLNSATTQVITMPVTVTGSIKVSWTVTGSSPSFGGVYVTLVDKVTGPAIYDGTNGPVAVKAASTSPASTDPALVVVLSPNQQSIPVNSAPSNAITGIRTGIISLGGSTANTLQVIRATTYTEQSSNAQRSISSSSTSDTSAGVGARTLLLTYYTSTGTGPFTETITLNGTSAVNTVATDICYIEKMEIITVGSSLYNVGTITLWTTTGGGGSAIGTIGVGNIVPTIGDGQTFWSHHYIPLSSTSTLATFVVSATSGGSGTNSKFILRSKQVLIANSIESTASEVLLTIGTITRVLSIPIKITGFARVAAYGIPGVNNATLTASFDYSEQ